MNNNNKIIEWEEIERDKNKIQLVLKTSQCSPMEKDRAILINDA